MSNLSTNAEILSAWPFADTPSTVSFALTHFFKQGLPILHVSHDEDGSWRFHSGKAWTTEDRLMVGLGEIVSLDPTIADLADLPLGWQAHRKSNKEPWVREEQPFRPRQ